MEPRAHGQSGQQSTFGGGWHTWPTDRCSNKDAGGQDCKTPTPCDILHRQHSKGLNFSETRDRLFDLLLLRPTQSSFVFSFPTQRHADGLVFLCRHGTLCVVGVFYSRRAPSTESVPGTALGAGTCTTAHAPQEHFLTSPVHLTL